MPDLYQNFVFTKCTGGVVASDTTVTVDDTSLLPSNTVLASNDFYLSFDSTLTYPPSFEIVRLVSVNTSTNVLTLVRGQDGTSAQSHVANTYLKGSITAGMLARTHFGNRATATYTTGTLAANVTETGTINLGLSYSLQHITTSAPARVRVYTTAAKRTADAARVVGADPVGDAGVMLEFLSIPSFLGQDLMPPVIGSVQEASPTTAVPLAITNTTTSPAAITVTFTYVRTE